MDATELKALLKLEPLTMEGGYFNQIYRSPELMPAAALPARYGGPRSFSTAIYYLLEPGDFSEMHCVRSDEVFHFYQGDAVEMLQLWPDGSGRRIVIGNDLAAGERPQVVVPQGVWQGTRLVAGGRFALLGCTVSPGFEYEDYESGSYEPLAARFPEFRQVIRELTRH